MHNKIFLEKVAILIDWILFLAALLAIIYLALEDLGVSIPTISENIAQLAFVGICLLIISTIWERRTILTVIDQKIDNLFHNLISASSILRSYKPEYPLMDHLEDVKSADFCGVTLSTTIQQYKDAFIHLAKNGRRFRFLLVDPDVCTNDREDKTLSNLSALIQFERLLAEAPKGKIEVRLLDRYPPVKLIILRGNNAKFNITIVEIFGYKTSNISQPYFELHQNKDAEWFSYYSRMFDVMWADAHPFINAPDAE